MTDLEAEPTVDVQLARRADSISLMGMGRPTTFATTEKRVVEAKEDVLDE